MANEFTQRTSQANNTAAFPRVDTQKIGLADYFNGDTPLVVRQQIQKVYPHYNWKDALTLLELSNNVSKTYDLKVRSYEQGAFFRPVKIGSVVGTPTATEAIITLTADSYSNFDAIEGTGIARTSLMKDSVIKFTNGASAIVRAKSSLDGGPSGVNTQFTLMVGVGTAEDIRQAITAQGSVPLFVYTNAYGEGTFAPQEGLENGTTVWFNHSQILKTYRAATGTVNAVKIVDWTGKDRVGDKQEMEMGMEHRIMEKLGIWYGSGKTYKNKENEDVRECIGVDTAIQKMGNVYTYTVNTFARADLDAIIQQLDAVNGGYSYDFWCGTQLFRAAQAVFAELASASGQTGGDVYTFGKGQSSVKMIDLGIIAVNYSGYLIKLINSDIQNLPELTGIQGYNFPSDGYLIPSESQRVEVMERDGRKKPLVVSSLEIKYTTDRNDNMRRYLYDSIGRAVTGRDQEVQTLLTEVVPQIVNTRKYIKVKAVNA